jgi:hypothetical protein
MKKMLNKIMGWFGYIQKESVWIPPIILTLPPNPRISDMVPPCWKSCTYPGKIWKATMKGTFVTLECRCEKPLCKQMKKIPSYF